MSIKSFKMPLAAALVAILSLSFSSLSFAGEKKAKKRKGKKITFVQCCEKYDNDSKKCQNIFRKSKKYSKASCPAAPSKSDNNESKGTEKSTETSGDQGEEK